MNVNETRKYYCPLCGQVFNGGWSGVDAHWRNNHDHEGVIGYDEEVRSSSISVKGFLKLLSRRSRDRPAPYSKKQL